MAEFGSITPQVGFGDEPPTGVKNCWAKFEIEMVFQTPSWVLPARKHGNRYIHTVFMNASQNDCGTMKMTCHCLEDKPDSHDTVVVERRRLPGSSLFLWKITWWKQSHINCPDNPCSGGWTVLIPDGCPPNNLKPKASYVSNSPAPRLDNAAKTGMAESLRRYGEGEIQRKGLNPNCFEIPEV
jgi:hypothetical protein